MHQLLHTSMIWLAVSIKHLGQIWHLFPLWISISQKIFLQSEESLVPCFSPSRTCFHSTALLGCWIKPFSWSSGSHAFKKGNLRHACSVQKCIWLVSLGEMPYKFWIGLILWVVLKGRAKISSQFLFAESINWVAFDTPLCLLTQVKIKNHKL